MNTINLSLSFEKPSFNKSLLLRCSLGASIGAALKGSVILLSGASFSLLNFLGWALAGAIAALASKIFKNIEKIVHQQNPDSKSTKFDFLLNNLSSMKNNHVFANTDEYLYKIFEPSNFQHLPKNLLQIHTPYIFGAYLATPRAEGVLNIKNLAKAYKAAVSDSESKNRFVCLYLISPCNMDCLDPTEINRFLANKLSEHLNDDLDLKDENLKKKESISEKIIVLDFRSQFGAAFSISWDNEKKTHNENVFREYQKKVNQLQKNHD